MTTPAQFAKKMHRLSSDVRKVTPLAIVAKSADVVSKSVRRQVAVAVPSGRLNVGRKGARIGVSTTVDRTRESAIVKMTGPAHLIEWDTKAHRIPRATGRGARRRGDKRPLFIPGIGFRANVDHPGTRGKYPFRKGVTAALPAAKKVAGTEYFDALRRAVR